VVSSDEPRPGPVTEHVARLLEAVRDWAADPGHGSGAAPADAVGCSTWCPVCQAAERVRGTSPEVQAHLTSAATSLLSAAASLLEGVAAHQRATGRDTEGGSRSA
jgi:hypothetical protein